MDLIRINERFMATNGGIGLGSEVAERINKIRAQFPSFKKVMKFSGKKIYSFFVVQELLSVDFDYYDLQIESKEFNDIVRAATILINNQPILAGTFNIAPKTRNDDGKFNVSILTHSSRARLVQCVYNISQGQVPTNDPDFISFETTDVKIKNLDKQKAVNFFGDGEIFKFDESDGPVNEWHIAIEKMALKVYSREADCGLVDFSTEVSLQ
jgi:diacylglycerol kinase family enzyme